VDTKTINQRNEALLKLQKVHAKSAGEPKKDATEAWRESYISTVQCGGTQIPCISDCVKNSGPMIHVFHCLG